MSTAFSARSELSPNNRFRLRAIVSAWFARTTAESDTGDVLHNQLVFCIRIFPEHLLRNLHALCDLHAHACHLSGAGGLA